jgi:hypothetical protein
MALALCFGLSGCDGGDGFALSVQPFYAQCDLDDDAELASSWTDKEDDVTFIFEQGEDKEYKLTVKEKDGEHESSAEFEAHLLTLGTRRFLDFRPKSTPEGSFFYLLHLVPAHSLARMELSQDALRLRFFDGAWLREQIDEKNIDVSCQKTSGAMLLTGTTDEVQNFLLLHLDEEKMFSEAIVLARKGEEQ